MDLISWTFPSEFWISAVFQTITQHSQTYLYILIDPYRSPCCLMSKMLRKDFQVKFFLQPVRRARLQISLGHEPSCANVQADIYKLAINSKIRTVMCV